MLHTSLLATAYHKQKMREVFWIVPYTDIGQPVQCVGIVGCRWKGKEIAKDLRDADEATLVDTKCDVDIPVGDCDFPMEHYAVLPDIGMGNRAAGLGLQACHQLGGVCSSPLFWLR